MMLMDAGDKFSLFAKKCVCAKYYGGKAGIFKKFLGLSVVFILVIIVIRFPSFIRYRSLLEEERQILSIEGVEVKVLKKTPIEDGISKRLDVGNLSFSLSENYNYSITTNTKSLLITFDKN